MRKILIKFSLLSLLAVLSCFAGQAQQMPTIPNPRIVGLAEIHYLLVPKVFVVPQDTLTYGSDAVGMLAKKDNILYIRILDADGVKRFVPVAPKPLVQDTSYYDQSAPIGTLARKDSLLYIRTTDDNGITRFILAGAQAPKVPEGPVTSMPAVGMVHTNTDLATFIKEAFFRAKPPLATLTGGLQIEKMAAGANLTYNLTWTAGRQDATEPLASINVAGVAVPNANVVGAGQTKGSNQNVSVVRNTNTTFTITVTTTDGQTATATTAFTFSDKRYFGWVSSINPTDAELIAAGSEFASNNTKAWTQAAPGTPKYLAYAIPTTMGVLTKFDINGVPSLLSMMGSSGFPIVRTLTNASGFTQSYYIYVTQNAQNGQAIVSAD